MSLAGAGRTLDEYRFAEPVGEVGDPDLVERNLEFLRRWDGPRALKLLFVFVMAGIWKSRRAAAG